MKTKLFMILAILLLVSPATVSAKAWEEGEWIDTTTFTAFHGKIQDARDGRVLPFATIEAVGSNIATVSNIDGNFTIKIAKESDVSLLKISYIGYSNRMVSLDEFGDNHSITINLDPSAIQIREVTIRPQDALELIRESLSNIKENFSVQPMMMRGFYRETIERGRNYVSISEAVVDIFKGAYNNDFQIDQVKLFKGRKSADVEKMDTVLFKLQGGPNTTILLDVVKNPYILLSPDYADIYEFRLADVISIDDRLHYVVAFNQAAYVDDPYYKGRLYIEMDRLAITEAEFELNVENQEEAARLFIQRKPIGMSITPERAVYRAKYTIDENSWFFSYARAEVRFKVDWKKKLFNTTFTTMSELAVTDRTYEGIEKFAARERFKNSDVMDEKVYVFFDQGFWEGYNVIEPDQSIESAIRKLNRLYLRRTG
ncbi:MAG: carboxypeptidase-like regulatory domain-containing protein [Bacteroidetes bacterium]|nr:MAG: carboxypeptidase-like regulatory domain-containing protein [Bacteroidota bacterium]